MRVADYIMHRLEEAGVGHVFLVTGRGALFLTDALAKNEKLQSVCNHHEQASAFAAVAYAEQTGGLGACLVSTGCASTNTLTGVLSAWQDAVPCIFISGQNTLRETSRHTGIGVRSYGQQEADIVKIVESITKYAKMIERPEEIFAAMDEALTLACSGRKGPVWIDVPLDLQSALIDPASHVRGVAFHSTPRASAEDVSAVVQVLAEAKRPAILIGSEVKTPIASAELRKFSENWHIPVTFDASAPDVFGASHNISIGSVGSMGCSRAGNFTIQNCDCLLVLGSRLTSIITGPDFCKFARKAKIIVVDTDDLEHKKESVRVDQFVLSDIGYFLESLNSQAVQEKDAEWLNKCIHWKKLFSKVEPEFRCADRTDLYELADVLSELLPRPSTLVTDSGLIEVILPTNLRFTDGVNCIHPFSQGAMGFALPAAIGAYFGKAQTIVAVIGDGSIMMNLQELETIRYHKLPIKILVVNNNVYSIIRRRQRDLFRKRIIGTDPANGVSCPDFSKVASCYDFEYVRIESPAELKSGLGDVFSRNAPVICEIMGRVDQEYIEVGHARSLVDKRFVRRPLEDQTPFLHRELFLSEMIIDPIDQ
jgi:acetolactate synthase-1/2/3 large subunit